MFCLRSWIPILFFLTNASPIYLILFISATYVLNRPCVYCSLLLAILVLTLFDFQTNWFEPKYATSPTSDYSNVTNAANGSDSLVATTPLNLAVESASLIASAVESAAGAMTEAVIDSVKQRLLSSNGTVATGAGELLRVGTSWTRKEWRVPCLDVVVRL